MQRNILTRFLLFLLVPVLFLLLVYGAGRWKENKNQTIYVAFRFDDYSSRSDFATDQKIIDGFLTHNLPLTVGVIPFIAAGDLFQNDVGPNLPLAGERVHYLQEALKSGTIEVALHGYRHQNTRLDPNATYTEFAGLPASTQITRIDAGKRFLESSLEVPVDTFIPPWNSYDTTTLGLLEGRGFQVISSDEEGPAVDNIDINYLPATVEFSSIVSAINKARRSQAVRPVIVVLLHSYDFAEGGVTGEVGISDKDFNQQLAWISSQEGIRVFTLQQLAQTVPDLGPECFSAYSNYGRLKLHTLTPPFLTETPPLEYIPEASAISAILLRQKVLLAVYYLLIFGCAISISVPVVNLISGRYPGLRSFFQYSSLAIFLLGAIYVLRDFEIWYTGISILDFLAGLCLGTWLGVRPYRRNEREKKLTKIRDLRSTF